MSTFERPHTIIIGAGIGGLTAGALLLQAGHHITVLEAHVYPGGSAGTFFHKGYRFDAGATLAGGFNPGGPHDRVGQILQLDWPIHPVDPAWVVHLPNGQTITQWSEPDAWQSEYQQHFPGTKSFWVKQERLAEIAWQISSKPFPWPPETARDWIHLAQSISLSALPAVPYLWHSVADIVGNSDPSFKLFLDAQLLISAQTTADYASALYGSAALDLPRRGVNHVRGGIGSLASALAGWIQSHGGQVLYRQKVEKVDVRQNRAVSLQTNKGLELKGDQFIANLTPWALSQLLGDETPSRIKRIIKQRQPTWGAFTLYLGLEKNKLPKFHGTHHQVIAQADQELGEGNSVFISLSDPGDPSRAPDGKIAATLSTHTAIKPWWQLMNSDRNAYLARRDQYTQRMLSAANHALPGIREAIDLCLPGTPITFEFFTRRPLGMVGGFPQTSLFDALGPRTGVSNLWLVGDSIFPGQSTAGVSLGAMRVAQDVLRASQQSSTNRVRLLAIPQK